jgi:hypothetical protein
MNWPREICFFWGIGAGEGGVGHGEVGWVGVCRVSAVVFERQYVAALRGDVISGYDEMMPRVRVLRGGEEMLLLV